VSGSSDGTDAAIDRLLDRQGLAPHYLTSTAARRSSLRGDGHDALYARLDQYRAAWSPDGRATRAVSVSEGGDTQPLA